MWIHGKSCCQVNSGHNNAIAYLKQVKFLQKIELISLICMRRLTLSLRIMLNASRKGLVIYLTNNMAWSTVCDIFCLHTSIHYAYLCIYIYMCVCVHYDNKLAHDLNWIENGIIVINFNFITLVIIYRHYHQLCHCWYIIVSLYI